MKVQTLLEKYPPSPACSCRVCAGYCRRPGWWTVGQARKAMDAGLAGRMMLELSPDRSFGVLSPAFRGNEGNFALQEHALNGCTFLVKGLCELHATDYMPLECRFCHHERIGLGKKCHLDIEQDWRSPGGRDLVARWAAAVGILINY